MMPNAARASRAARLGPKAMPPLVARVFAELADGRFHSGEALARALGVSRSAVWKAAAALRAQGSALHAVPNRGYRLSCGSEPLDPAKIRAQLAREVRERIASIEAAWAIGSTNTALLERANPGSGSVRRRPQQKFAHARGAAVRNTAVDKIREVPQDLGALGLVIGVCALRALREHGVGGVSLKWPNDLLVDGRKLGGVLIDLRAESAGAACVVIGIGLNMALGAELLRQIAASGTAVTAVAVIALKTASSRATREELAYAEAIAA